MQVVNPGDKHEAMQYGFFADGGDDEGLGEELGGLEVILLSLYRHSFLRWSCPEVTSAFSAWPSPILLSMGHRVIGHFSNDKK